MKKLLCYQCFNEFRPHEVWFRCENTASGPQACALKEDRYAHLLTTRAFPFRGGFWATAISFFKAPMQRACDQCGFIGRKRICPKCHWELPYELGQEIQVPIALEGDSRAGTSHYLAVLLAKELQGAAGLTLGVSLTPLDLQTWYLYRYWYHDPLFLRQQVLEPTTSSNHRRLIWGLSLRRWKKRLTLVFCDFSGGHGGSITDQVDHRMRYLWQSRGIIYLVNPPNVPTWGPNVGQGGADGRPSPDCLFSTMIDALRRQHADPRTKIHVPIAVCISQFDRLRDRCKEAGLTDDLFDPKKAPIGAAGLNEAQAERESEEIKDFMLRTGGGIGNVVRLAEQNFERCRFFAVSALGNSPIGPEQLVPEIQPNRVAVPLMWLVYQVLGVKN